MNITAQEVIDFGDRQYDRGYACGFEAGKIAVSPAQPVEPAPSASANRPQVDEARVEAIVAMLEKRLGLLSVGHSV